MHTQPAPHFDHRLSPAEHDCLWDYIRRHFHFDAARWQPLLLNGHSLGLLNPTWRERIERDWQGGISVNAESLALHTDNWLDMADALQHMAYHWHQTGLLDGWRNEKFDAFDAGGRTLFALERAAFRPLGLQSRAIHINGLVQHEGRWQFWIGRRSPYKAVDPNKLDNLVGGGISSGESIEAAMLREGEEEAGLSAELLQHSRCQSERLSLRPVSRGLHREILYIFDAVLPDGFHPENQDGEVAAFNIMPVQALTEAMYQGRLMNDALLATLDAFARFGLLDSRHPLSRWLQQKMPSEIN